MYSQILILNIFGAQSGTRRPSGRPFVFIVPIRHNKIFALQKTSIRVKKLVPRVGLEPTRPKSEDFESSMSTISSPGQIKSF